MKDLSNESEDVRLAYRILREAVDFDPAENEHDALWYARVMARTIKHLRAVVDGAQEGWTDGCGCCGENSSRDEPEVKAAEEYLS